MLYDFVHFRLHMSVCTFSTVYALSYVLTLMDSFFVSMHCRLCGTPTGSTLGEIGHAELCCFTALNWQRVRNATSPRGNVEVPEQGRTRAVSPVIPQISVD